MRIVLKFTILAVFSAMFLMQTSVSAQDKTTGSGKSAISGSSKDLKVEFPDIEGWDKDAIRKYPTAELGYSIAYQSAKGGTVSIYVYSGGYKSISNDLTDKTLKSEMESAKNGVFEIGKAGYYQDVKEIKSETVTLGGTSGKVKALYSLLSFSMKGQELDSEIYLFGYRNNFIKIRSTRPKADGAAKNKDITKLLEEIDKLFSN